MKILAPLLNKKNHSSFQKTFLPLLTLFIIFGIATPAMADPNTGGLLSEICIEPSCLNGLVLKLIKFFLSIAAIVAVIVIILNGFKLIASAGNEDMIATGKSGLTAAVVGLIIVILAYFIVRAIAGLLGVAK